MKKKNIHCNVCGKTFSDGMSIITHMRLHSSGVIDSSGKKIPKCAECRKRFVEGDLVCRIDASNKDNRTGKTVDLHATEPDGKFLCQAIWESENMRMHTPEKVHSIGELKAVEMPKSTEDGFSPIFTEDLTNEQQYILIMRWLYLNDKKFNSSDEWRKALIDYIAQVLNIRI